MLYSKAKKIKSHTVLSPLCYSLFQDHDDCLPKESLLNYVLRVQKLNISFRHTSVYLKKEAENREATRPLHCCNASVSTPTCSYGLSHFYMMNSSQSTCYNKIALKNKTDLYRSCETNMADMKYVTRKRC